MKLIVGSLVLLSVGVALPFLMVLDILRPGFALSFLAYSASLSGLMLGLTAAVQPRLFRRRPWE